MSGKLIEIRWHGRGGQGAVTSAELVAQAAINEGKYAQAFPSFTPERRGAPVLAFNRINAEEPIRSRAEVYRPDIVIILDATLLGILDVTSGLKDGGTVIINTKKSVEQIRAEFGINGRVATVDASRIAQEAGIPAVNTTMIGALIKATNVITFEGIKEPLERRFARVAERNLKAMERAYQETVIRE
ncbi:MAG TPA: pyruvate synthase [Dehalococcoidia bacterium]|jgi:pyruvate ferredoxin oxidoreductase gamma subunit|nr:pyruvate synthase [Dehalococcoidia bacterium]